MSAPELVFIPNAETITVTATICCGGRVDDGRCDRCEFTAPVRTDQACSACDEFVADITPDSAPTLECGSCGARWNGITADLTTDAVDGLTADGWNPTKAPEFIADYLDTYRRAA